MQQTSNDNENCPCVLVVEDEFFIALEIRAALRSAGFEVLGPARSVDHAVDLLRDARADAAVLDVDLGGEWVTPVALQLKALGVPFVLVSAADPVELAQNSVLAEVRNVGKPTDMRQLTEVVGAIALKS